MGNRAIKAAIVLLLAVGFPALAQPQDPPPQDPAAYEAWRIRNYEDSVGHPKPMPFIPTDLRDIVSASRGALSIRGLTGQPLIIDITELEPTDFTSFADRRFIGFAVSSVEYSGYRVVDRAESIPYPFVETGAVPSFSPDNRYFVAAEMSGAGFGDLNGIGAWEAMPDGTANRFFTDAVPPGQDWRIERWMDPTCVQLSAIDADWQPPDNTDEAEARRTAPRRHYALRLGETVTFVSATDFEIACADMGVAP